MKSPLWIINSILMLFFISVLGYIVFSSKETPTQISLRSITTPTTEETEKKLDEGFLKAIYEDNDLFGTYVPKSVITEKEQEVVVAPPLPPRPKPSIPLPTPSVSFMEPLRVSVTGIIMSTNEADNQVIISDNATKQEKLYRVGDKILDAHILRIFANKVIFIRANGQQETLFVNTTEAQAEIKQLQEINWDNIIRKQPDGSYIINTNAFIAYISSLAQFIDLLDLTTVFSQGVSIGVRIGKMHRKSVGFALGLMPGDIITLVNNIPPTHTNNRVEIYNKIRGLADGARVNIELLRGRNQIEITYQIEKLKAHQKYKNIETQKAVSSEEVTIEKEKLMKEKYKFNSTIEDFKKRDRLAMMQHGSKQSVLSTIHRTS